MRLPIGLVLALAACGSPQKRIGQDTPAVRDTVQTVHDTMYERRAPGVIRSSSSTYGLHVLLSGVTQGCFTQNEPQIVSDVNITAFHVANARALFNQLKMMDTLRIPDTDPSALDRFLAQYSQMLVLDTTTTPLARATSASNGAFSLGIPPTDSVLVVGYEDVEDQPFFYSYTVIPGRSSLNFILDMSPGGPCPAQ
jgi:hypothetical protein